MQLKPVGMFWNRWSCASSLEDWSKEKLFENVPTYAISLRLTWLGSPNQMSPMYLIDTIDTRWITRSAWKRMCCTSSSSRRSMPWSSTLIRSSWSALCNSPAVRTRELRKDGEESRTLNYRPVTTCRLATSFFCLNIWKQNRRKLNSLIFSFTSTCAREL